MTVEPRETASGRIVSVVSRPLGAVLAADALTGETVLTVVHASDADEMSGGTVVVGDNVYDYTAVDNDLDTITLASGLLADAFDGDRVDLWDPFRLEVQREYRALVALPGTVANDDAINALVAQSLAPQLAEGNRDLGEAESVVMELFDTEWVITDVRGRGAAGAIVQYEWSAKGSVSSESGSHALTNDTGRTLTLLKVRVRFTAGNGPVGGDFTVQVQRDGSDIFTTPVTVPDGELTAVSAPDLITTWPDGDYLTVVITSTAPGTDPVVTVVTQ